MEKKQYTLGFVFSEDKSIVVLILKEKPDWQKGRFNGIGGKLEDGELVEEGFIREFKEEAGVELPKDKVEKFCEMYFDDALIHVFRVFDYNSAFNARTTTKEAVYKLSVNEVLGNERIIFNLNWLIPMAMERHIKNTLVIHHGIDSPGQ